MLKGTLFILSFLTLHIEGHSFLNELSKYWLQPWLCFVQNVLPLLLLLVDTSNHRLGYLSLDELGFILVMLPHLASPMMDASNLMVGYLRLGKIRGADVVRCYPYWKRSS